MAVGSLRIGRYKLSRGLARFDGDDYIHERDAERLTTQLDKVRGFMLDRQWRTLREIAIATGAPEASVSAQIRNLRKKRFGSYYIARRHVGGGLYEYRLLGKL